MCTVTIVPKGKSDFILTSNRDEAPNRVSIAPEFYTIDATEVLFPKDELSGGTWIGISEKKRVICVLNGGFEIHQRKPSYRLSRGVVAKQLMVANAIIETVNSYNFEAIEPFTIVIADWNTNLKFFELVWDGEQKHFTELPLAAKIWSSSTLYNATMRAERQQWFEDFKVKNTLDAQALMNFHKTAGAGNEDYGVIMNRGFVKTTSVTQIEKSAAITKIQHDNFAKGELTSKSFKFPQPVNG